MTDSSNDSAVSGNEVVFVVYFDPTPPGTDMAKVSCSYVKLVFMQAAIAEGVILCIDAVYVEEFKVKLVGFGAHGVSVNQVKKEVARALLQLDCSWWVIGWFVAHRLELSLKDALNSTVFKEVDDLILRLCYLQELVEI